MFVLPIPKYSPYFKYCESRGILKVNVEGRLKDNTKGLFVDYAFKYFSILRIVGIYNFVVHWKINKLDP